MRDGGRGTVVVGLGNPIMGDDGFGLAVLNRLQQEWMLPDDVELVDGGTWGLTLLPMLEDAERVLLLDAIEAAAPAGTLVRVDRDDLPRTFALRTSPHQVDLSDVLAIMRLRGTLPERIVAIGAQPERVEMSTELSAALHGAVAAASDAAAAQLAAWGHDCRRRVALAHA
jgi:hydrogenase maturation protease